MATVDRAGEVSRDADEVLGQLGASPAMLLAQVGHAAQRRLRAALTSEEISPRQFQLLRLLFDHGPTSQQELGQATGIDPSILVTLLNPLEDDGLVLRRRDPADRRRHLVTLTEPGKRRLARAAHAVRDAEEGLLADLDDSQRSDLRALLSSVRSCVLDWSPGAEERDPDC